MDDLFTAARQQDSAQHSKGSRKRKKKTASGDGTTPYVLQLHSAYFSAQVNNDYFINKYQPYYAYQGQYKFPELGGMTKGGFSDLFENHHFTIAYALPAATEGSTFFIKYENTARNLDWGGAYFRKVETLKPDPNRDWVDEQGNKYPNNAKAKTHYYQLFFKRPLTYYSDVKLETGVRQDRTVFLATDKYSLDFPPLLSTWSVNTLAYSINKLKPTIPFLFKGFKAKVSLDAFKGFTQEEAFVSAASVDISYHQPLYKMITLVTQLHAAASGGDQYILYNLGGEDNNVTPRVDTTVHFAQSAPYAFQTLVTPFRGRYQNSLYGDRMLLFNTDVYFPIFQTLIPITTPLPFINNIQLGTLADIATASERWNPNNRNNGKWLWSYGFSARSSLAGYPLHVDIAWPGTFRRQPVVYFSISM